MLLEIGLVLAPQKHLKGQHPLYTYKYKKQTNQQPLFIFQKGKTKRGEKSTYHPSPRRTGASSPRTTRRCLFRLPPGCNPYWYAYILQCVCHDQTDTPQLWCPVKEGGQPGITRTNQVAIDPQPLVLPILLGRLLLNDECMIVLPLRERMNTKLCERVDVSIEFPELRRNARAQQASLNPTFLVIAFWVRSSIEKSYWRIISSKKLIVGNCSTASKIGIGTTTLPNGG